MSFSQSVHQCSLISGEDISVTIVKNHNSNVSFLRAHIINNFLLVCQQSKLTGDYSLAIYRSTRKTKLGAYEVPLFLDPFVATYHLFTGTCSLFPLDDILPYQPAVLCVGVSDSGIKNCCDIVLEPDIFSKLFGSELALSGSPVLILGCQNGQVVYWSEFSQANITQNLSSSQQLPILYALGQPVQSIHAVRLPEKEYNQLTNISKQYYSAPNSLLLVGHLGKIVVCTTGAPQQRLPSFLDFNIPGPITSATLIQNNCFLFTTSFAVHRICLKEDCIKNCSVISDPKQVTVPELRFRLPSTVAKCASGTLLLSNINTSSISSEREVKIAFISLSGAVTKLKVPDCNCENNLIDVKNKDENELAVDLKECLQSLEVINDRLDELRKKEDQQNVHLAELSRELSILSNIAHTRYGPNSHFHVSYSPSYQNIGVIYHKPCIDVCFTHVGSAPVSQGWSLLVQSCRMSTKLGSKCTTFSRLIPLTSLQPGNKVCTQIILENFKILRYKICCYLHYDTSYLLHKAALPTTATILHSQESFDLIDFLLPLKFKPQQVPWRILSATTQQTDDEDEFPHYKEIVISMDTVTKVIAGQENEKNLSIVFLGAFLAKKELVEIILDTEPNTSEITLNSYDGSKVCLLTSIEEDTLVFSVYSTSDITLHEAVDCIQSRISKYD